MLDIKPTAEYLKELKNNIKKERDKLHGQLSQIDQKQEDILHYIEFNKWDAVQGMRLLKALKICRNTRRDIKIRFAQIMTLDNVVNGTEASKVISQCDKMKAEGIYKPKVVKDIFDLSQYEPKE